MRNNTPELAIAISVYDKFSDVALITDLIRDNWNGKFFICVTSSHPDAKAHLSHLRVDQINIVDKIPYDPQTYSDKQKFFHLFLRVLDCIQTGCTTCLESGAPYTLHIHADAFPFSWEKIKPLLKHMNNHKLGFAFRGYGFGFYCHDCPIGEFDDMFFFFDNEIAKRKALWDFSLFDFLPHKLSIHGILPLLTIAKLGIASVWHYATNESIVHWDSGHVSLAPLNSAVPMYYDPKYDFLHIHKEAFSGEMGNHLLAYYLKNNNVVCGNEITKFLQKHEWSREKLMAELLKEEQRLIKFFRRRGLEYWIKRFHFRQFNFQSKFIDHYRRMTFFQKMNCLAKLHIRQLKSTIKDTVIAAVYKRYPPEFYYDKIWPKSITDVYEQCYSDETQYLRESVHYGPVTLHAQK